MQQEPVVSAEERHLNPRYARMTGMGASPAAKRWALAAWCAAAVLPGFQIVIAPRTLTINGADVAQTRLTTTIGQIGGAVSVVALLAIALLRTPKQATIGRAVIFGVWGMAFALFVGGLYSPMPTVFGARSATFFACGLTAVIAGLDDWQTAARWARNTGRFYVFGSIGSALLAHSWAFIGQGYDTYTDQYLGYDRTLLGQPRLLGLAPHPDALATTASIALFLEVAHRGGRRWVRRFAILAALACILFAQSNTADIAVVVGLLVMLAARRRIARWWMFVIAIGLIAVTLFDPTALVPSRLSSSDYLSTVSGRTQIWDYALAEWHRHPWFGYGPNMWSANYLQLYLPGNMQQATNAHDQFMQSLSTSGAIGALALVATVLALIVCAFRAARIDRGLSLSLAVVLIVTGLTEVTLTPTSVLAYAELTVLAVVVLAARSHAATQTERTGR